MALDLKESNKDTKNEIQKERRSFLKKAVYSAPAVISLGQLIRPVNVNALDSDSTIDNNWSPGGSPGGGQH